MKSARCLVRFLALIAALSVAGCSGQIATSSPSPSPVPGAPIAASAIDPNAVWHLVSMTSADGSVLAIEDPAMFTLMLADDGRMSARADCNRASAAYAIDGRSLSIGLIASTRAYCSSAPVDQQFLSLLGGENIVTTPDAMLQLTSPRGTLRFRR
jgi:heat shock protein HslJ